MLATISSGAFVGVDAYIVTVEVDISDGPSAFSTVGLPDSAVKESKDRVTAAIKNSSYNFPANRITVNLAPAYVRKEGSAFDLPIALGLLTAAGQIRLLLLGRCAPSAEGTQRARPALRAACCACGMGCEYHPLKNRMRVVIEQHAILETTRLTLVRIADNRFGTSWCLGDHPPFFPCRKSCATAPGQLAFGNYCH